MKSVETPQKAQRMKEYIDIFAYINTWTKCSTEGTIRVKRVVTKQKQIFVMCVTDKKYWRDSLYKVYLFIFLQSP